VEIHHCVSSVINSFLNDFMVFGMVAYVASAFASPWVITCFLRFIGQPTVGRWVGFTTVECLLFLLHVLGPMAIVTPLVLYTLLARPMAVRWRMATMLTPLIIAALNAFWFVPLILALGMPRPLWAPVPAQLLHESFMFRSWAELRTHLTLVQLVLYTLGVGAALAGLIPTTLSRFDMTVGTHYFLPAYYVPYQEGLYVTSVSDGRRRVCDSPL
jgi:hypothetical protein